MQTLSLNGTWKLTYRDQKLPGNIWGRWINAQVPGDVHSQEISFAEKRRNVY